VEYSRSDGCGGEERPTHPARGYGYADFEDKQLMQPDSMFRIGGNSKVLTSMAILHLKDQSLINLDAGNAKMLQIPLSILQMITRDLEAGVSPNAA
jgi:CubicO group peptidase (beta-lactamase class C family)